MRRAAAVIVLRVVAVGSLAAGPSGPETEPEVVDPCGDTESHVDGTAVDHPLPEGTDLRTIDVVDREDGSLDVAFEVCGDRLPVATNDQVALSWHVPTLDGCDGVSRVSARVLNDPGRRACSGIWM